MCHSQSPPRTCTEYKTQAFLAFLEMLRWFAGDQIRNVAVSTQPRPALSHHCMTTPSPSAQSIGGNLVTASPISDLNPILMAVGATAHIASRKGRQPPADTFAHSDLYTQLCPSGGQRSAIIDENFFVSYRVVAMEPSEVLVSVLIPFVQKVCPVATPTLTSTYTSWPYLYEFLAVCLP